MLYIITLSIDALQDYHPTAISDKVSSEGPDAMAGYFGFWGHFLCYIMLISPSVSLALFYAVMFVAAVFALAALKGDLDNPHFVNILALTAILVIYGVTFFFILQTRELKRFFQQQDATTKERQMTHILNLHNDAIVVVESRHGVSDKTS